MARIRKAHLVDVGGDVLQAKKALLTDFERGDWIVASAQAIADRLFVLAGDLTDVGNRKGRGVSC